MLGRTGLGASVTALWLRSPTRAPPASFSCICFCFPVNFTIGGLPRALGTVAGLISGMMSEGLGELGALSSSPALAFLRALERSSSSDSLRFLCEAGSSTSTESSTSSRSHLPSVRGVLGPAFAFSFCSICSIWRIMAIILRSSRDMFRSIPSKSLFLPFRPRGLCSSPSASLLDFLADFPLPSSSSFSPSSSMSSPSALLSPEASFFFL
mmetsp:Transcript_34920/g.29433  ORF Transcript_34920/g.29433 Transcript_34920/m.29433 type:complete len:210 (-) Transcript_34920:237-866(-)